MSTTNGGQRIKPSNHLSKGVQDLSWTSKIDKSGRLLNRAFEDLHCNNVKHDYSLSSISLVVLKPKPSNDKYKQSDKKCQTKK
jgi:hypothetical protein